MARFRVWPRSAAAPGMPMSRPRGGTRWLAGVTALALAALAVPSAPAYGHGIVLESTPRHQDTVEAPKKLTIRFNSRLEKRLCSVTLVGPRHEQILLVRQEDHTSPDTLVFPLPNLEPGAYRAKWKVLATDGHVTEGAIAFTVEGRAAAR